MSRIGKKPIILKGVKVKIENGFIFIEGPKGKLDMKIPEFIKIETDNENLKVVPDETTIDSKQVKAYHGLYRALIQNMVTGVISGYEKRLEINGVGLRAKVEKNDLVMNLGFSKPVIFPIPQGISVKVENKDTLIILNGIDKQLIGNVAASIRSFYPPEPYKGKGIRYSGEYVRRKKGKRVA